MRTREENRADLQGGAWHRGGVCRQWSSWIHGGALRQVGTWIRGIARRRMSCLLSASLLFFCAMLFSACGSTAPNSISDTGFYFDTVISVTLYDTARQDAIDGCFALADRYEGYFSDTIETSDISQINAQPFTPVKVHEETLELIEKGIAYGELSGGRFDITVGKLSEVWDFSEDEPVTSGTSDSKGGTNLREDDGSDDSWDTGSSGAPAFTLPEDKTVRALASGVDYHAIEVDRSAGTVTLHSDACAIDLGGIAKGYIADRMKEYLESEGVTAGLINLGGNILTLGKKPDGGAYAIGIQKPFAKDGEAIIKLTLTDRSVVTSGTYQRYAKADGRIYHHILDVSTGYPYDNGLSSVTVLSASSTDGDALSTSLFALGLEDGLTKAEELDDIEAIFITTDNKIHYTSGFINGHIKYEELK